MSRIDRRTALRRAAAPSVDLSLMPDAGAVRALLEAANQSRGTTPVATSPTVVPPVVESVEEPVVDDPADAPVVPQRFRMRPRPTGHPTLQPHDAPIAAALRQSSDDEEFEAALAFVRAHRASRRVSQPPTSRNAPAPTPLSAMPTLIHFGRESTVDDAPERAAVPRRATLSIASGPDTAERLARKASATLQPRAEPALTLTPNAEEKLFWDAAVEPARPVLLGEDEHTLGEAVDPELDAWMARRGRSRVLTALGVAAAMLLLLTAAAGGVAVMAQPGLMQGAAPVEAPAPPPPPRPLRAN